MWRDAYAGTMEIKLAISLTLLAASCSSVPRGAVAALQEPGDSNVAVASPRHWDQSVTLAWNRRYVGSEWEPADDHQGVGVEFSSLARDEDGGGTGVEVGFSRADSTGDSYVVGHGSTWRRWTDYTLGVRHERPLGRGRWLLSGGASYVHVDMNSLSIFGGTRWDLGSMGLYLRTGYIQPLGRHLELVVSGRYRHGENDDRIGREVDFDQAGIDVGLTWRF
ncbi:MAG: hypothetical protein ACJAZN_002282 [Planctomycetota bacterium]|jgi:hypothetical protein